MYRTILCAAAALFIASQAEAQTPNQIAACVNNSSGTIHIIVQAGQTCASNEIALTWNNGGWGGIIAAASYNCVVPQSLRPGPLLFFNLIASSGSVPGTNGTQFNSFVLQPGFYQMQLYLAADGRSMCHFWPR